MLNTEQEKGISGEKALTLLLPKNRIFNDSASRGTSNLIDSPTTNLREWNRIKYSWASNLYRNMLNNFWIPEEISLSDDLKQYQQLTESEKFATERIIGFLNFLDSIQCTNIPRLLPYISAPEVASLLNIQAFQEEIHAQSYSYILDTITDPITRDKIYDMWREDEQLFKRNKFIADIYEKFSQNPTKENFLKTVMANYILEGIYFYSGFAFFYSLAKQGKLTSTATVFKYINRDEIIHLVIFQQIIKELRIENPELFSEEMIDELSTMMRTAVEHEIAWGQYVTNNKIIGLNNSLIDQYIKYLANTRMNSIGLPIIYKDINENPLPWVEEYSRINNSKTDFFEKKVTSYNKVSFDDLE